VLAGLHHLLHLGRSHGLLGGHGLGECDTRGRHGENGANGNEPTGGKHWKPLFA
jgi:hypothetical protein